jgi:S1-C subfamily serine protease
VGTTAASAGIGHLLWPAKATVSPSAASPSTPSGTTSPYGSGTSPFGSGTAPFGSGTDPFGSASQGTGGGDGASSAAGPSDVSAIAAKVDPALVDIDTTFGYQEAAGAGTGIVLTSNGEILTNNHVIDGATRISVTDIGNGKTYSATVVGYDSADDIAVLQLSGASGLKTAKIGNSSSLKVGTPVVAIGNAGGTGGTPTAAGGSVTALDQAITASDSLDGASEQLSGLIEVNADVQSGDSGGSLVDSSGAVVGMDSAASDGYSLSSDTTQGYAIPINEALSVARQIESGVSSSTVHVGATAFLGVLISTSDSNQQAYPGFGAFDNPQGSTTSGAPVSGVVSGSAAATAGLVEGDVITSIDGQTVTSASDISELVAKERPGQSIQIGWQDASGQSHTATVVLTSGPPS